MKSAAQVRQMYFIVTVLYHVLNVVNPVGSVILVCRKVREEEREKEVKLCLLKPINQRFMKKHKHELPQE